MSFGFNSSPLSAAYMRRWTGSALFQEMVCRLFGAKPSPKSMPTYYQLDPLEQTSAKFGSKLRHASKRHTRTWNIAAFKELTHWARDKMAAISQTTFSNALSWMKMFELRLRFNWSLFSRFELRIFQHCFRQWLGADQATSHYLNQWCLVYWRIYASLGRKELKSASRKYISDTICNLTLHQ